MVAPRGRFQLLLFPELANVADELLNLSVGQLVLISRHFLVLAVRCGINQLSVGLLLHFIGTEVPGSQFLSCRRISASVRTVTRCTLRLEQAGSILLRSRRQGENKGGRSQQKRGGDCSNKSVSGATVEHFNQGMHHRLSPRGILLNLPDVQEQPDNS